MYLSSIQQMAYFVIFLTSNCFSCMFLGLFVKILYGSFYQSSIVDPLLLLFFLPENKYALIKKKINK